MLNNILGSWKNRTVQLFIIILGYVISILVTSGLISGVQKKIFEFNQSNFGKLESRTAMYLYNKTNGKYDTNTLNLLRFLGKTAEVDILRLDNEELRNGNKVSEGEVVPFYYENKPDWQPALYSGRFITPKECKNNDKKLLLGIGLAEDLKLKTGDFVSFYGMDYEVVGILGKMYMDTNFDRAVYIPIGSITDTYTTKLNQQVISRSGEESQLNINILYRVNENNVKRLIDSAGKKFNSDFKYDIQPNVDLKVSSDDVLVDVVVVSLPLLIVALINIISISIFWIDGRKKEISIKKALGANDRYIKQSIEKDMLLVAVISSLISVFVQSVLFKVVEPVVNKYRFTFNLSWLNLCVSLLLALFIGYIASLIPVKKTLEMNPADAVKVT
ncbi:ABC transporter permease [Clostridium sp. C8-1-8]|uniref:ABC transporter permease n=1 Tax=Clostridium sp. C8-1-8 TaxID=2698831 RepID=UPI0013714320|nr:ABC transporter permease [Clostridium sp. C8-1-8]